MIEDVSKCKHNEVVLSVFSQLVACLEKGFEYAMQTRRTSRSVCLEVFRIIPLPLFLMV